MSDCPKSSALTALMEGWLEPEDADRLRDHVETCSVCRQILADLETAVSLIARESGPVEPPTEGYEALLEAALAERDRMPVSTFKRHPWMRRAVAAAAVLLLAASAALVASSSGNRGGEVAREAVDPDILELMQEHEYASGQLPFSDGSYMALMADEREQH
jgi:anti-sigma factor RsiW